MSRFNPADYVTVAERLQRFYEQHPEGSLRAEIMVDDGTRVLVRATAYRDRDDDLPGVGHAEEIRGAGPVNKTSAIENAETSAWGRAIAALGFEVTRGVATREEMEQAEAETQRQASLPPPIGPDRVDDLKQKYDLLSGEFTEALDLVERFKAKTGRVGVRAGSVREALAKLNAEQANEIDAWLARGGVDDNGT